MPNLLRHTYFRRARQLLGFFHEREWTMSMHDAGVFAGTVSTTLFVASYLPMLVKAARTKDLSSYSAGNLVIANIGNVIHTVYVLTLPPGPLWALHGFYLASTAVMLLWWWRFRDHHRDTAGGDPRGPAADEEVAASLPEPAQSSPRASSSAV